MPSPGSRRAPSGGSLTVVGTGIDVSTQLTPAARAAIEIADTVLYLVADSVSALRITTINTQARSLDPYYAPDKARRQTYAEVVGEIVSTVLEGRRVCAVFYGHPGFFVYPGHEAIARVRAAGHEARMLPAVSALDCLFADLGIDPSRTGLHVYEATYFFERRPAVDLDAMLVLLQAGMIGEEGGAPTAAVEQRLRLLVGRLGELYGEEREAVLYEASPYPGGPPEVVRFRLGDADLPSPTTITTLCVPPGTTAPADAEARTQVELSGR